VDVGTGVNVGVDEDVGKRVMVTIGVEVGTGVIVRVGAGGLQAAALATMMIMAPMPNNHLEIPLPVECLFGLRLFASCVSMA
jgi:hypothetical protein